jgi:hypothetical protein
MCSNGQHPSIPKLMKARHPLDHWCRYHLYPVGRRREEKGGGGGNAVAAQVATPPTHSHTHTHEPPADAINSRCTDEQLRHVPLFFFVLVRTFFPHL